MNPKTLCLALLALAAALIGAACDGGGGGGKKGLFGTGTVNPFDMQASGPPATGVQVDRPFSVTLNFFAPGTVNPFNVPGSETISVSVTSGPGAVSGTTSMQGNNTSSLTFSNLIINAQGSHVLTFSAPHATAPVATAAFTVGPQMDLRFSSVPGNALVNQNFTVVVQTVQPGTTTPVTPPSPVAVTLERATGTGTLGGTTTVNTSGSTATFSVSYNVAETITLRATAYGFPSVTSAGIIVDAVVMTFATPPASVLVNGVFSLTVNLTGQVSGAPLTPNPAIQASLTVASGTGSLTGNTTNISSSGSTITFTNLRYNQVGAATFTATSASAVAPVTTPTINFTVNLTVTATGPTTVLPNTAFSPFNFRVVDGTGATWTGAAGPLSWVLTNSGGGTVQSGSANFTAGVASVTPSPIATVGSYTLTGSITNPNAASANIGISVTNLTFINQPGPFVALKTCRVGTPYTDSVSFAAPSGTTGYGLMSGSLPAGLNLNTTNGTVSGTPTTAGSYSFTLYAQLSGSNAQPIRCALAVFSVAESEIVSGQNFGGTGPYTSVGPLDYTYTFTSSYDGIAFPQGSFPCRLQVFHPNWGGTPTPPSPAPVYIHHRGRGFNMASYNTNFGPHVARWGYIFITVEDFQSFSDGGYSGQSPISTYDSTAAERGMMSASAFQEAVMNWVITANSTSGHALFNRVDVDKIFMGGHSRGGGATHGSHVRSQPYMFNGTERQNINIRGVIYFMAFDLRFFSSTVAGSSVVYPVATMQPRLPSLVIAAENDGDLVYPYCDQFIDRSTGPSTFATIYGGVHAFLSDSGTYDQSYAYITRAQQMQYMFNLVIAFLKRWSNLDLSLEGLLYNNEYAGSSQVGITAYRNMMETTLVDNHQNGSSTTNTLGGTNTISGGTIDVTKSVYTPSGSPPGSGPTSSGSSLGNMGSLNLRHGIISLPASTTTSYQLNIPSANQDQSRAKRLVFRIGSIDISAQTLKGFDYVTVRARLYNGTTSATVTLFDRNAPSTTYLPDYPGSGSNVYDRMVDASVPLSQFTGINLSAVTRIELVFETAAGVTRQVYVDDIRFE
jgi:hypothetical protein